jgi:hypothetical protein
MQHFLKSSFIFHFKLSIDFVATLPALIHNFLLFFLLRFLIFLIHCRLRIEIFYPYKYFLYNSKTTYHCPLLSFLAVEASLPLLARVPLTAVVAVSTAVPLLTLWTVSGEE